MKQDCIHQHTESFSLIPQFRTLVPHYGNKILWHITNFTDDMQKYKVILAFEKAFQEWQTHFGSIKLESTSSSSAAHIHLCFKHNGELGLPVPFSEKVLAYAMDRGRIFINDGLPWGDMHSEEHYDLYKVITHEIGHVFRVGHSKVEGDIMAPIYNKNAKVWISPDTQAAIRQVYKDYIDLYTPKDKPKEEVPTMPGDDAYKKALQVIFSGTKGIRGPQLLSIGELLGLGTDKSFTVQKNYDIIQKSLIPQSGKAKIKAVKRTTKKQIAKKAISKKRVKSASNQKDTK